MRTWFRLLTMWDLPEQTSWLKKTISPWQSKRSLISWLLVYGSTCNATIKVFWHKKIYWQKVAEISLFFLYDHMPQIVYHFSHLNRERKCRENAEKICWTFIISGIHLMLLQQSSFDLSFTRLRFYIWTWLFKM